MIGEQTNRSQIVSSEPEEVSSVYSYLEESALKRHLKIRIHKNLVEQDDDWLYIPVYLDAGEDIVDRARYLQDVEDDWRNQEPEPYWQLLLIPAAN